MEPCTQKGCRYQRVMSPSIVETGKGGDRKKRKPSIKLVEPNMGWEKKKKSEHPNDSPISQRKRSSKN